MKNMLGRFCLTILVFGALVCAAWSQAEQRKENENQAPPGWAGKIEIKNGTRTVFNPDQPLFGELALDLERNLVIGDENGGKKASHKWLMIQVDDQGCIYALDYDKSCIQKFSPSGRYLMTIGRKGQGPGELYGPLLFHLGQEGRVLTLHSYFKKIGVFGPDGEFEKTISSENRIDEFARNSDESLFAQVSIKPMTWGRTTDAIVRLDPQGRVIKTMAQFLGAGFYYSPGSRAVGATGHYYSNWLVSGPLNGDLFCYGHSSEYKITIMNSDERVQQIIIKDETPAPLTEEDKQKDVDLICRDLSMFGEASITRQDIEKGIPWPKSKPLFSSFMTDEKARIYVEKFWDLPLYGKRPRNGFSSYDVFDRKGVFVYRLKLPVGARPVIRKGFFYGIELDKESGNSLIVRYRIKNYDKMKETS
jgi:hypothetical protein